MRLLFRPEAVEAQSQQWLGPVRLVRPLSLAWASGTALVLVAALVAFAFTAPYIRTMTADGRLLADGRAEIGVPAAAVSTLQPGQPARLHFEALPSRAGGHASAEVEQWSRTPRADGLYAVTLRLAPQTAGLEPGMRLTARVALERGRLVDRLLPSTP
jgi:hypothetical protein